METFAAKLYQDDDCAPLSPRVRGVSWVLGWATTLATLTLAAVLAGAFACQLSAEAALHRAADAGIREAVCDRASRRSVDAAVRRQLAGYGELEQAAVLTLARDVRPARVHVTLSAPVTAALPRWLRVLVPSEIDVLLIARRDVR
jgi:hypothetical protein